MRSRTSEARGRAPRWAIWLSVVGLALLVIVCVVLVWPQVLGAERALGIAQLVSFRAALGIGLAILAVSTTLVAVLLSARRRRIPIVLTATAAILVAATVVNMTVLADRGWYGGPVVARGTADAVTVLSWNAQGGATSTTEIAELVLAVRADIVALPETDDVAAAEIVRLLDEHDVTMTAHTTGEWIPTSLLISDRLGVYRQDLAARSTPGLPSGVWVPDGGTIAGLALTVVVAHPMPPLPSSMQAWRDGLDWVAEQCRTRGPDVIIAGDLNATLDHLPPMPACRDAALATGAAGWGTWPSTAPAWLAAPIDHVLAGTAWRAVSFRVVETEGRGSDHRPVVAVFEPA